MTALVPDRPCAKLTMRYTVYEYGCLPPIAGEETALEQMRLRVEFWNALVGIEQGQILKAREILKVPAVDDRIAAFRREFAELRSQLDAHRAAKRKAGPQPSELRSRIESLKAAIGEAVREAKELRPQIVQERRAALDELNRSRKDAQKVARAKAALYWCNADEVLALFETARIRAIKQGRNLRPQVWKGAGTVSVKYQRGLPAAALPKDSRFQIDPVDPRAWSSDKRSIRRRLARTHARIRVGSTPSKHPVWLEIPFVMHRPLPETALIRRVSVQRVRIGKDFRYRLLITLQHAPPAPREDAPRVAAIGIHIGFQEVPAGIRFGYWADTADHHAELLLPHDIVSQFERVDELRGIIDRNWNAIRALLLAWLAGANVPERFKDTVADLPSWMDYGRPLRLVETWRQNRFQGDDDIFRRVEAWRRQHVHLYSWASHLRDQVQKRRREHYRLLAASICRTYARVYLGHIDLKKQERSSAEGHIRNIAAISGFHGILSHACERESVELHVVEQEQLPDCCPVCDVAGPSDPGPAGIVRCKACGATLNRDHRDAMRLLRLGPDLRSS